MTERRQLLTSPQVAKMLGKSIRTIQRMAEAGDLPAMKLPGETGAYVYDPTEIELWQLRRRHQEAKETA